MNIESKSTVVKVSWGGAQVMLQMESPNLATMLCEHLRHYRNMQPYVHPDNPPSQGKEPGFLADLGRAYYAFLDPQWVDRRSRQP